MAPRQKHRDPIIDAAVTLFRRQGYAGTGLNDIVDYCGAPKGSLYHYFPNGKVSIAVAAVEEAGLRVAATLQDLARNTPSTGAMLIAYAGLLAKWMRQSGYRDGCPMTTTLLELAPGHRDVTAAGRRAYAARLAAMQDKLMADGHGADQAARLAVLCTSAMQGALIQARVDKSGAPLDTTARELAQMLHHRAP